MKKIVCIVQENMFLKAEIRKIEAGFKEIYSQHYSREKLTVLWRIMPKGYAYSERKLSEATIIMIEVGEEITKEKREELMHLYSQFLLNNFKISPLDSVISVANSSFVNQFFAAQTNRVHPRHRRWIGLKMKAAALTSKWTNGYYKLRVNM